MEDDYYVLELVKVTKDGHVEYIAAESKMVDNILATSGAYTHIENKAIQFDAEFLGEIKVYPPPWMMESIREGS